MAETVSVCEVLSSDGQPFIGKPLTISAVYMATGANRHLLVDERCPNVGLGVRYPALDEQDRIIRNFKQAQELRREAPPRFYICATTFRVKVVGVFGLDANDAFPTLFIDKIVSFAEVPGTRGP